METYSVELAETALRHIMEIRDYISISLKSPKTARNVIKRLYEEIASLSTFPFRFPLSTEDAAVRNQLRKMPVGNYLVYYQVLEDSHQVEVAAVVYACRDQKQVLQSLDLSEN